MDQEHPERVNRRGCFLFAAGILLAALAIVWLATRATEGPQKNELSIEEAL